MSLNRESIPSIPWSMRIRDILPDKCVAVKQGKLNIWIMSNQFVCELVIGEKSDTGKITTPGAITMTNEFAYRNTSSPQEIADDIYTCNQGEETVAALTADAASVLGKLGGSSTSNRKAAASRRNGRKGGRPRKDAASAVTGGA